MTEVSVTKADGWNLVENALVGNAINTIDFQFGPKKQIDGFAAMTGVDVSSDASFNMGYAGGGKETVSIDSSGDVARLTHDITKPIPVATISWTVAAADDADGKEPSGTPSETVTS